MKEALALLLAYLWGAFPTAYLVARLRRGIDIRRYGSGNVGASNLMATLGRAIGFLAGAFDALAKGTLPVALARYVFDLPLWAQVGVGLAAVAGHNWSPYIGFTGGRGVATTIGVLLGFFLWRELLFLGVVMGLIGWALLKDLGFWTFLALLSFPVLTFFLEEAPEVVVLAGGLSGLLLLKRLSANWRPPPAGYPLSRVLLYRLLLDRDVPRKVEWVTRRPPEEARR